MLQRCLRRDWANCHPLPPRTPLHLPRLRRLAPPGASTQLGTHEPAVVGQPRASELLIGAVFALRMDQFNAIDVGDP
jgi:hypothetical protein